MERKGKFVMWIENKQTLTSMSNFVVDEGLATSLEALPTRKLCFLLDWNA
jgi:hypothetical protein